MPLSQLWAREMVMLREREMEREKEREPFSPS